jgi:hypothetical protein
MRGLAVIVIAGAFAFSMASPAVAPEGEEGGKTEILTPLGRQAGGEGPYQMHWAPWDWNDRENWVSSTEVEAHGVRIRLGFRQGLNAFPECNLLLQITNLGESAATFQAPIEEAYDFAIWQDGKEVWRFSRHREYAETPPGLTLAGGETAEFKVICVESWFFRPWPPIDVEGTVWLADGPVKLSIRNLYPEVVSWGANSYSDVPLDHWAYDALRDMQQLGFLLGYPDDWFNGDRTLTRYDMAQAVARLLDTVPEANVDLYVQQMVDALTEEFAEQLAEIKLYLSSAYSATSAARDRTIVEAEDEYIIRGFGASDE